MDKKTVIVFGAAGGIGRCIVEKLKSKYYVIAADLAKNVLEMKEDNVCCIVFDMLSDDLEDKLKKCLEGKFSLYGVVFSAGVMIPGSVCKISEDDWCHTMDLNLNSIFRLSKILIPELLKSKKSHIISLASNLGIVGAYDMSAYAVSKAALIELMKCMALDYGSSGLLANTISPGFAETDMLKSAIKQFSSNKNWMFACGGLPRQHVDKEDIADTVKYLLGQNSLNGANVVIDNGYSIR